MPTGSGQSGDTEEPSGPSSSSPSMQSPTTSEHPKAPLTKMTSQQSSHTSTERFSFVNNVGIVMTKISMCSTTILNSVTYPTSQPGKSPSLKATTSAPSHTSTERFSFVNDVGIVMTKVSMCSTTISTSISTRDTSAVLFSTISMPDDHRATTPEDIAVTVDMDYTDQEESKNSALSNLTIQ